MARRVVGHRITSLAVAIVHRGQALAWPRRERRLRPLRLQRGPRGRRLMCRQGGNPVWTGPYFQGRFLFDGGFAVH